jgi:hypothetical protein
LETLVILLTKKLILRVRNKRTDAKLAQEIELEVFIPAFYKMPFLSDVEQEEVGSVVQVIIKAILRIEGDRRVDTPVVECSLDPDILVGKDIFGMVEVDLET